MWPRRAVGRWACCAAPAELLDALACLRWRSGPTRCHVAVGHVRQPEGVAYASAVAEKHGHGLARPTVSKYLSELRRDGLVDEIAIRAAAGPSCG
jgi:hypothetical protein